MINSFTDYRTNTGLSTIRLMGRPKKDTEEARRREGEILRQSLANANMTQQQLADERGVEQNLISQWCTGKTRIPDIDLLRLGKKLGFDALSVRPSLIEYQEFYQSDPLLEGLTDEEKVRIKAIVSAFKESAPKVKTGE